MKTEEEAGSDRGRGGTDRPVFTEGGVRNRRMMILCDGKKKGLRSSGSVNTQTDRGGSLSAGLGEG